MKIKNIIFDLGGVFYKIDKLRTVNELAGIAGPERASEIIRDYDLLSELPEILAFEKGECTVEQFRDWFRNEFQSPATDAEFDNAWSALLLGLDEEAINAASSAFRSYRCFLLSTNNAIHYERIVPECGGFFNNFERTYFSHKTGNRKPDALAFTQVLNENGILPEETIFFDDSPVNVRAGKILGIQSILYQNPDSFAVAEL